MVASSGWGTRARAMEGETALGEWRPGTVIPGAAGEEMARSDGRTLELARDPSGSRTLFYGRRADGAVVFDSRLGRVISLMGRPPLDPVGLATYLSTAYVPAPDTLIQGVRAGPPGSVVRLGDASETVQPPDPFPEPLEEADEVLRERLR